MAATAKKKTEKPTASEDKDAAVAERVKKNPNEKLIEGVSITLVDEKVLDKKLKSLKMNTNKPVAAKVRDLMGYYKGEFDEEDHFVCDKCGGLSVEDDDHCPFCGDAGEVIDAPQAETKEEAADKPPKGEKLVKTTKNKGKNKDVIETAAMAKYTVKDLDDKVTSVRSKLSNAAIAAYEVGSEIRELYETDLWKMRTVEDAGKTRQKYRNFKDFCQEEFGITGTWAYNLMDISAAFSREQVAEIGTKKLQLVLAAPEKNREELIEAAKQGASRLELEAKVAKLKGKATTTNAPPAKPEKKRLITVGVKPGRKTIDLLKRPKDKKAEPLPAKRMADEPFAKVALDNDTVMLFRLQTKATGEWQLVWEVRREDS